MGEAVYPAWCKPVQDVAAHHDVDIRVGLTDEQVATKREEYGYNELEKQPGKPLWELVLEQFDDMLVKVLLAAAIVSLLLAFFDQGSGEEGTRAFIEPAVILLILILNAVVGVWQESNAEAALEALKEMQSETACVLRDGKTVSDLPARELVPGDVVTLHVGDRVPADCRIASFSTATLRAEQASLTGEAVAVQKSVDPVPDLDCQIHDKDSILFASTAITNGTCTAIVNSTGMSTEIGKIQAQIQAASLEEEDTPLKKKLNAFGETLAQVIFVVCVLVWLINYRQYLSWKPLKGAEWLPDPLSVRLNVTSCIYYFKIAVALAVAAIPEGLPAVITTCLALGTRKMARRNAIVRKLPSVETLGCTTVICSDKTGTLTTNQMSCLQLLVPGKSLADIRMLEVEGTSYSPDDGSVLGIANLPKNLEMIAEVCALCNDARVEARDGKVVAVGAPTEAALVVLAEKLGVPDPALQQQIRAQQAKGPSQVLDAVTRYYASRHRKLATLEFDRHRKSMSVICAPNSPAESTGRVTRNSTRASHANTLFVKGASEFLLTRCSHVMLEDGSVVAMDEATRTKILNKVDGMAAGALRCLALAFKPDLGPLADYSGDNHPGHKMLMDPSNYASIESGLVFLGVTGLLDPPRPEVRSAIQSCNLAGVRVIVITGDNKLTAEAICSKIGVFAEGEVLADKSLTGREFTELPPAKQRELLAGAGGRCFSRAEPKQKQDIVRMLKDMGEVTAMTGDGVNDAPALKLADIGIAMGITGTEVAKEACDMVLADDNFSTIVAAVEEGRAIYNNMKAFIRYMISSNIGEVASIFITAALGLPENLIPVQLLWVNLVTDGPPATALGFNPPDVDIMEKPPRPANEELITPWIFFRWMLVGIYVGCATVGVFVAWYMFDNVLGIDLSGDGHTTVTWYQLTHWNQCSTWKGFQAGPYTAGGQTVSFESPCDYFSFPGKAKASTLSLSVLVAIEMFNALNALSEDNSLLQMPPWCNPWLLVAMALSFGLHFVILYVPVLAQIFSIVPLSLNEWLLVVAFAFPVVLIDEGLKFVGRHFVNRPTRRTEPGRAKAE